MLLFDECHKAKNLVPDRGGKESICGKAVERIQNELPKARVVYCSATGVSALNNLAYMVRLGLWGPGSPFPLLNFKDFHKSLGKGGFGVMELIAMELKRQGSYVCRILSFESCIFNIKVANAGEDRCKKYDDATDVFQAMWRMLASNLDENNFKLSFPWQEVPSHTHLYRDTPECKQPLLLPCKEGKYGTFGCNRVPKDNWRQHLKRYFWILSTCSGPPSSPSWLA